MVVRMSDLPRIQLLVIVAEPTLEQDLLDDLQDLGVKGWTIHEVRGQGTRHSGFNALEGNVRIEALMSAKRCKRVLDHLASRYFTDFSLVAFAHDVDVVRTQKFVGPDPGR